MRRRALLPLFGLTVALGGSFGCIETWRCGYGGPGCSEPDLLYLCEPVLVLDAAADVLVTYSDDTGRHPATVTSFESSDRALLEVVRGDGDGELTLTARGPGEATLTLEVEGWDAPRSWEFALVDSAEAPPQDDDDDDCSDGVLVPDAP